MLIAYHNSCIIYIKFNKLHRVVPIYKGNTELCNSQTELLMLIIIHKLHIL